MPSYVTRPNKSMSADRSCSRESCSSSSPQTDSCQSMSQLLGPSKKPSRVIRFNMTSSLTFGSPQSGRHRCRSFKYLSMMLLLQDPRAPLGGRFVPPFLGGGGRTSVTSVGGPLSRQLVCAALRSQRSPPPVLNQRGSAQGDCNLVAQDG